LKVEYSRKNHPATLYFQKEALIKSLKTVIFPFLFIKKKGSASPA
jgi:hypothetical protein